MARKLERLSPKQKAQIPVVRDEWLRHGLSTAPANRKEAEAGVAEAYRAVGLAPPAIIVWLDSPLAGAIGSAMLASLSRVPDQVRDQVWGQVRDQVRGQVRDQVRRQVRDQVWDQVRGQVGGQVRGQLGGQVWDQVWGQVRDQVRDQVWGQVRGQVWGQVRDQVWDQVRAQVGDQVWGQVWGQVGGQVRGQLGGQVWDQVSTYAIFGQHEAGWLSFYEFFRGCGVKGPERLAGIVMVAQHAGWWWPFEDAVVLTNRPELLNRDEEGRLHCEDGPSVRYRDGWGIWAWHGVRVPQQVIEDPDSLEAKQISAEPNLEVRRVMLERYGPERYLRDVDARLLEHVHEPPFDGLIDAKLWRVEFGDDEPLVMLECRDSTPGPDGYRQYMLRVPPSMASAHEAIAWTFEESPESYVPAVET